MEAPKLIPSKQKLPIDEPGKEKVAYPMNYVARVQVLPEMESAKRTFLQKMEPLKEAKHLFDREIEVLTQQSEEITDNITKWEDEKEIWMSKCLEEGFTPENEESLDKLSQQIEDQADKLKSLKEKIVDNEACVVMLDSQIKLAKGNYRQEMKKLRQTYSTYKLTWPELKDFEKMEGQSFYFLEAYFKHRPKYMKDDQTLRTYYNIMTLERKKGAAMMNVDVDALMRRYF